MLERDRAFVYLEAICDEVEARRGEFPTLERVHEIWICDTATFGIRPSRILVKADHTLLLMRPIICTRGSSPERAGISSRSGSRQRA
jgi:hypothetical protein